MNILDSHIWSHTECEKVIDNYAFCLNYASYIWASIKQNNMLCRTFYKL